MRPRRTNRSLRPRRVPGAVGDLPHFGGHDPRDLRLLALNADRLRLPAGHILAEQGRLARSLVIVVQGHVVASRGGRELGHFGPGTAVGAAEVLSGATHRHTLVASDDVEVLVVSAPAYRWAARTLPGLAARLSAASPAPPEPAPAGAAHLDDAAAPA